MIIDPSASAASESALGGAFSSRASLGFFCEFSRQEGGFEWIWTMAIEPIEPMESNGNQWNHFKIHFRWDFGRCKTMISPPGVLWPTNILRPGRCRFRQVIHGKIHRTDQNSPLMLVRNLDTKSKIQSLKMVVNDSMTTFYGYNFIWRFPEMGVSSNYQRCRNAKAPSKAPRNGLL